MDVLVEIDIIGTDRQLGFKLGEDVHAGSNIGRKKNAKGAKEIHDLELLLLLRLFCGTLLEELIQQAPIALRRAAAALFAGEDVLQSLFLHFVPL